MSCKWCAIGQCWGCGQIAKSVGGQNRPKQAQKMKAVVGKFASKQQQFVKKIPAKIAPSTPGWTPGKKQVVAATKGKGKKAAFVAKKAAPVAGKKIVAAPVAVKSTPPVKQGCKKQGCKWCILGECWSHAKGSGKGAGMMAGKKGGKGVGNVKQQQAKQASVVANGKFGKAKQQQLKQANVAANGKVKKQQIKQATVVAKVHPKQELHAALHALLERLPTKEDLTYETEEVNGKFIAALQIAALDTDRTEFKGKPADNKKLAEANAAQKCLNVLQKEIKEAKAAHEARKAAA